MVHSGLRKRRETAVDQELRAGDVGRFVGREVEGGLGDFLRLAEAAHRHMDQAPAFFVLRIEMAHEKLGTQRSRDSALTRMFSRA